MTFNLSFLQAPGEELTYGDVGQYQCHCMVSLILLYTELYCQLSSCEEFEKILKVMEGIVLAQVRKLPVHTGRLVGKDGCKRRRETITCMLYYCVHYTYQCLLFHHVHSNYCFLQHHQSLSQTGNKSDNYPGISHIHHRNIRKFYLLEMPVTLYYIVICKVVS